jgi:hypothetical protein
MTFAEIAEQALLIVTGGTPSTDSTVWRQDIYSLAPAAIDKVNRDAIAELLRSRSLAARATGTGAASNPSDVLSAISRRFTATLAWDETMCAHYAIIPAEPLVSDISPFVRVGPIGSTINYMYDPQGRGGGLNGYVCFWVWDGKIYFSGIPNNITELDIIMAASKYIPSDEDEDARIVPGYELTCVQLLAATFSQQRNGDVVKDNITRVIYRSQNSDQ